MTLREQLVAAHLWDRADPRDPSQDIAAAWLIVAHMLDQDDQGRYLAFIGAMSEYGWCAPEHTACTRICLAALATSEGA